jgi:lysophospholipase L1-like esterase
MSIAYDGTSGAGAFTSGFPAANCTWNDHITGNYAFVVLNYQASGSPTPTCTMGGTSMTLLNTPLVYVSTNTIALFGLASPPTGSSVAIVGSLGGSAFNIQGASISYTGVGSVGTPATNSSNSSSSASDSVSSSTGDLALVALASNNGTAGNFTSFSGTSRVALNTSNGGFPVLIGDAAGSSTVNFTATAPASNFGAVAVDVAPSGSAASGNATGKGTLSPTPSGAYGGAHLTGKGTLSAVAHATKFILTASPAGLGTLSAATQVGNQRTGSLHGKGTLTTPIEVILAPTPIPGTGVLSGTFLAIQPSGPHLAGQGALSAAAAAVPQGVAFDAVGPGLVSAIITGGTATTLTHTPAKANAYVILGIIGDAGGQSISSVTYGGNAMTSLGSVAVNNNPSFCGILFLYGIANQPATTKTISFTPAQSDYMVAGTVSYQNVSTVSVATAYGASTSPATGSTTCNTGQAVVGMLCWGYGGDQFENMSFSGLSGGTNRYSAEQTSYTSGLAISDATSTTNFTGTLSSATYDYWAAAALTLTPPITAFGGPRGTGTLSATTKPIIKTTAALSGKGALVSLAGRGPAYLKGVGTFAMTFKQLCNAAVPVRGVGTLYAGAGKPSAVGTHGVGVLSGTASNPQAVQWDATGAGFNGEPATGFTFSHTPNSLGSYVILAIGSASPVTLSNVTYGGAAMTLLGSILDDNNAFCGTIWMYGIRDSQHGALMAQTVSVSMGAQTWMAANTVGYSNVTTVSASVPTNYGESATLSSGAVTCGNNQRIVNALGMGYGGSTSVLSSPTGGTNRYLCAQSGNDSSGLAISDSGANATFGLSASNATTYWASITVKLNGGAHTNPSPSGNGSLSALANDRTKPLPKLPGKGQLSGSALVTKTGVSPTPHGQGTLTAKISNPFFGLLNKLANGLNANIQILGDSTAAGVGGSIQGGWSGAMGVLLGTYFNCTVTAWGWGTGTPGNEYLMLSTLYTGSTGNTLTIYNGGIGGSTLSQEESDITNATLLAVQNGYPAPDCVIIYDGYNDIGTALPGITPAQWVSDVQTYLSNFVLPLVPGVPVVFCTQHTAVSGMQTVWYTDQSAVAQMLTGNGLPLTPALQVSNNSSYPDCWSLDTQQIFPDTRVNISNYTIDGLHPNNAGYTLIAEWMLAQLADGNVVNYQPITLPGTGTLSVTLIQREPIGTVNFPGHGQLHASAFQSVAVSAALTGNGLAHGLTGTRHLLGTGTLSAVAHATKFVLSAALAGHGASAKASRAAGHATGKGTLSAVFPKVTIFTVDGTQGILNWTTGAVIPIPNNPLIPTTLPALLNPNFCEVQNISWEPSLPMANSISEAFNSLSDAIVAADGPFMVVGYSQGAAVVSEALNSMQSGELAPYASSCVGGVTFGNLCRQEGSVAPVQTDPGGHGVWTNNLITDTPSWWWDFALPLDAATAVPDTVFGVDIGTFFDAVVTNFDGGALIAFLAQSWVTGQLQIDLTAVPDLTTFLFVLTGVLPDPSGMISLGPHGSYYNSAPPGASQTCAQLAANYINEASAAALAAKSLPAKLHSQGVLSATASGQGLGGAPARGAGTLAATIKPVFQISASLTGSGSIASSSAGGSPPLHGTGKLSATTSVKIKFTVPLAGHGQLVASTLSFPYTFSFTLG